METFKLALDVLSLICSAGVLSFLIKLNNQWFTIRERVDVLWLDYCRAHNIPFRSIGKDFPQTDFPQTGSRTYEVR